MTASAILVSGGSGAGKSTTTVELVAGGLAFLTDELVELDPATGTVRGLARADRTRGAGADVAARAATGVGECRPASLAGSSARDRCARRARAERR